VFRVQIIEENTAGGSVNNYSFGVTNIRGDYLHERIYTAVIFKILFY
jgi:hypothetical protein